VTTEGHRDILELRRGNRPIVCDLRYERDPVLIERDMRFELAERVARDVRPGYISRDAARDVYGVVLDEPGDVRVEETTRLRSELAQVSGKGGM